MDDLLPDLPLCECEEERAAILEEACHYSREKAEALVIEWRTSGQPKRCDDCTRDAE